MQSSRRPPIVDRGSVCGAHGNKRRAISLLAILVSLVIVVLATITAASTFVAVRVADQQKRTKEDLAEASQAVNKYVVTVATHEDLKGIKMEPVRKELLENALAYYDNYIQTHASDDPPSPQVAEAYFRKAGLQAKLGMMGSVTTLNEAMAHLDKMREAKLPEDSFPSMRECAMEVAAPNEWIVLKRASFKDMQSHATNLFLALGRCVATYGQLYHDYPKSNVVRDDYSFVLGAVAMMQARFGRTGPAHTGWMSTRRVLEELVADAPQEREYKARLADAALASARLEKADKKNDAAAASYQRAIELQQQLVDAHPDDKDLQKQLASAQAELAKLEPAQPKAEDAPAAEADTADTDAADTDAAEAQAPSDEIAPAAADEDAADAPAAATTAEKPATP